MAIPYFKQFLFLTLLLAIITSSQSEEGQNSVEHTAHQIISQSDIQNKEHALEEQFKKQIEEQLNAWVTEQIHSNSDHPEIQPYESIIFYLEPNVTQVYRVPVSLQQTMRIQVSLYHVDTEGGISIPENPEQTQFVELMTIDESSNGQILQGKTYVSKIFQIKFPHEYKIFKFRSNDTQSVMVVLDLQQQQLMMELAVSDNQFELTNKKMQALLKQTKETEVNREHLYKWQWGFYQKHQRHQVDMLGFTGAQLFAIIGTSIVQMYCIRSLIDNELII